MLSTTSNPSVMLLIQSAIRLRFRISASTMHAKVMTIQVSGRRIAPISLDAMKKTVSIAVISLVRQ